MSLVPFHPQDGREIVLRSHNAIVVRDPTSQRLEIRGLAECPTCRRPLGASSPERPAFAEDGGVYHHRHEGYVDPNYFRMLRAGHHRSQLHDTDAHPNGRAAPPPGALRRFLQPLVGNGQARSGSSIASSAAASNAASNAASEDGDASAAPADFADAEFVSSTPAVPSSAAAAADASSSIRKEAFSPHYFRTFFVEERELGRGGKGVVLLVRHEIDGCQLGHFACKRVPVGDDHAWLEKVLVEVELLAKLSHPNLVSYRHVWLENVTLNRFGPSVACAFILQQYCNGGDLQHYVIGDQPKAATKEELKAQMRRRSKGHTERPANPFAPPQHRQLQLDEIYSLFRDITSGLDYLHKANYIHRDLKPSNCLLHREGRNGLTCLISDFGEVQPENVVRRSSGTTGTISYCAPEVLRKDATGRYGNFTTKSDIFSLGMILYFMCFGHLPYRNANIFNEELEDITELRAEISQWGGFHYESRERSDLPLNLYRLLAQLLSVHPAERPSANEVLHAMRSTEMGTVGSMSPLSTIGTSAGASMGSMSMAARRFQKLDPAGSSSTPTVPDPVKRDHAREASQSSFTSVVDDLDEEAIIDDGVSGQGPTSMSAAASTAAPRHSLHKPRPSMTLTLSRSRHDSLSPDRLRRRRSHGDPPSKSPSFSPRGDQARNILYTPLLMPPPTTFMATVQHHWRMTQHFALLFLNHNAVALAALLRFAMFFAKMATLARPCWPFMVRWEVGGPLVGVAALDLGSSGVAWRWDWRVSLLLFVFHFVVLLMISPLDTLCTGLPHDAWAKW